MGLAQARPNKICAPVARLGGLAPARPIMRGGAWVGGASEAVNIVKCLLLKTRTDLVEAGYIRITASHYVRITAWQYLITHRSQILGRLKSLLI